MTVNGHRFKRLILCDSYLANEIATSLESFVGSAYFPTIVARYEREIWLEYVDGTTIESVDEQFVLNIAKFYHTVYTKNSVLVDTRESVFLERLLQNLHFLYQINILSKGSYQDIRDRIPLLTPQQVWVGFDYTDPVLKNFLLRLENGRLCVVDVDGLARNQLLGIGVAKACVRWLGPYQPLFFSALADQGGPDFYTYFPFVELCFLAKWTKRAFLEHDWKVIDSNLFERFRQPCS